MRADSVFQAFRQSISCIRVRQSGEIIAIAYQRQLLDKRKDQMVLESNRALLSLKDKNKIPDNENKTQSQLEWIRAIVGKYAITLPV